MEVELGIPSPVRSAACGATAGLIGQSICYPLDVVRRRFQTDTSSSAGRLSIMSSLRSIVREGGWRALFKGLSMNWIKGPIAHGCSFGCYDILKKWMNLN